MTPIICCIKVGVKYSNDYVNRLYAMVERHTTKPHDFLCLTDDCRGLDCAAVPIDTDLPGWWAKLVLFKPHQALEGARVIFLDLDTVIVGNMDCVLDYDGPFAILRDFYHPDHYGSAVMSIAPGFGQCVWDEYTREQHGRWWGDQAWIEVCIKQADRWQDLYPGKLVSYKVHCNGVLPQDAAIVCFHGEPRPHEVQTLPWMQQHWTTEVPA